MIGVRSWGLGFRSWGRGSEVGQLLVAWGVGKWSLLDGVWGFDLG